MKKRNNETNNAKVRKIYDFLKKNGGQKLPEGVITPNLKNILEGDCAAVGWFDRKDNSLGLRSILNAGEINNNATRDSLRHECPELRKFQPMSLRCQVDIGDGHVYHVHMYTAKAPDTYEELFTHMLHPSGGQTTEEDKGVQFNDGAKGSGAQMCANHPYNAYQAVVALHEYHGVDDYKDILNNAWIGVQKHKKDALFRLEHSNKDDGGIIKEIFKTLEKTKFYENSAGKGSAKRRPILGRRSLRDHLSVANMFRIVRAEKGMTTSFDLHNALQLLRSTGDMMCSQINVPIRNYDTSNRKAYSLTAGHSLGSGMTPETFFNKGCEKESFKIPFKDVEYSTKLDNTTYYYYMSGYVINRFINRASVKNGDSRILAGYNGGRLFFYAITQNISSKNKNDRWRTDAIYGFDSSWSEEFIKTASGMNSFFDYDQKKGLWKTLKLKDGKTERSEKKEKGCDEYNEGCYMDIVIENVVTRTVVEKKEDGVKQFIESETPHSHLGLFNIKSDFYAQSGETIKEKLMPIFESIAKSKEVEPLVEYLKKHYVATIDDVLPDIDIDKWNDNRRKFEVIDAITGKEIKAGEIEISKENEVVKNYFVVKEADLSKYFKVELFYNEKKGAWYEYYNPLLFQEMSLTAKKKAKVLDEYLGHPVYEIAFHPLSEISNWDIVKDDANADINSHIVSRSEEDRDKILERGEDDVTSLLLPRAQYLMRVVDSDTQIAFPSIFHSKRDKTKGKKKKPEKSYSSKPFDAFDSKYPLKIVTGKSHTIVMNTSCPMIKNLFMNPGFRELKKIKDMTDDLYNDMGAFVNTTKTAKMTAQTFGENQVSDPDDIIRHYLCWHFTEKVKRMRCKMIKAEKTINGHRASEKKSRMKVYDMIEEDLGQLYSDFDPEK